MYMLPGVVSIEAKVVSRDLKVFEGGKTEVQHTGKIRNALPPKKNVFILEWMRRNC